MQRAITLDRSDQVRQIALNDHPQLIQIELPVLMNEDIAEPDKRRPWNSGQIRLQGFGKLCRSFPNYRQAADDRVLLFDVPGQVFARDRGGV